jgi:hypothetical protein
LSVNASLTDLASDEGSPAAIAGVTLPTVAARAPLSATDQPVAVNAVSLQEKIAAAAQLASGNDSIAKQPGKKDFLKTANEAVATAVTNVGTGVAQAGSVMPAALSSRSKSLSDSELLPVGPVAGETPSAIKFAPETPATVATPRETMAAVVSAINALETRASTDQKRVDLQFHVGDQRLALRVELRDGTVYTTFRTDSPELRTALAQEWHSVVQPVASREMRLADPVFSSSLSTGGESASGSKGQGSPREREPGAPRQVTFPLSSEASGLMVSESAPAASLAISSNQLLHAFA